MATPANAPLVEQVIAILRHEYDRGRQHERLAVVAELKRAIQADGGQSGVQTLDNVLAIIEHGLHAHEGC